MLHAVALCLSVVAYPHYTWEKIKHLSETYTYFQNSIVLEVEKELYRVAVLLEVWLYSNSPMSSTD